MLKNIKKYGWMLIAGIGTILLAIITIGAVTPKKKVDKLRKQVDDLRKEVVQKEIETNNAQYDLAKAIENDAHEEQIILIQKDIETKKTEIEVDKEKLKAYTSELDKKVTGKGSIVRNN